MITKRVTQEDIDVASKVDPAEQIDPFELRDILADTTVSKVMAMSDIPVFSDPGTTKAQVAVCNMGAVIRHAKHNVASSVEEERYQLNRFVNLYAGDHSNIVAIHKVKMSALPSDEVSGVLMKYRPKRKAIRISKKVKDFTRFDVVMSKHGSYPNANYVLQAYDLMPLSMVTGALSPMALYSVMVAEAGGAGYLNDFVTKALKNMPLVPSEDITSYFSWVKALMDPDYHILQRPLFTVAQLDSSYAEVVSNSIIPNVAKDKGINNNIRVMLQPYGSVTLQLGCALFALDPEFRTKPWHVRSSSDVANMLDLIVETADDFSSPTREGVCEPMACNGAKAMSRQKPPFDSHFMNLGYDIGKYSITKAASYEKSVLKGKRAHKDYFGHDQHVGGAAFPNLMRAGEDDGIVPLYKAFVVVMPVRMLVPKYCEYLLSCYKVIPVPAGPAFNFSVYLVGYQGSTPNAVHRAKLFGAYCATLVMERNQLVNKLYRGCVDGVSSVVSHSHSILEADPFVCKLSLTESAQKFVVTFNKKKTSLTEDESIMSIKPKGLGADAMSADTTIGDGNIEGINFFHSSKAKAETSDPFSPPPQPPPVDPLD
jgi:hypothetical protein